MAKIILNVDLQSGSAEQELAKFKKSIQGLGDPKGVKNIDTLRKSYANLINTIQSSEKNYKKGTFSKIAEDAKKYLDEVKKLDPATSDYAKKSKQLDDELKRLQADFAETKTEATNFHGSLKDLVVGFMKFQLAATLVMKPLQLMKNAYEDLNETLVETEKRVVSLRRVAGDSANADELYKLAQKYGQTFDNVADVVENLVKSGYTWEESLKAAEPALLAINVAELDATQATEGLIAVVKQYGLELEDLNYIQGVLNKTADNAAVTTEKLLIALQKTGSTAKNANISFEETVGLITALSEGTAASGQNIGNALRSLIVFTSDSKALDKFATLSGDMAEIVERFKRGDSNTSILDIWQGLGNELNKMGSQKGTLEDLFGGAELSADIEAQLTQITDSFAEIYGTAGNYRQNYFIALLDNIAKVEDATKDLSDATSYSQKENEKYLDTYEAKVNKLNEKWKELANDEQGFLAFKKGLVDIGEGTLNALNYIGGLEGAFETIIAVSSPFFISWGITFGSKALSASKTAIVSLFNAIKSGTLSAQASLGITGALIAGIITVINSIEESKVREFEKITNSLSQLTQKQAEYRNYTSELQEIEKILKDSTSTEEKRAIAQKQLFEIQNNLINSNGLYADSIDVINGKLDNELEKINKLKYEIERQAVSEFYQSNTDAYSNLNSYFADKENLIEFSDLSNMWESKFANEFSTWLLMNGYSPISVTEDGGGVFGDLWSNISGIFGAKTWKTGIAFKNGVSVEDRLKFLKEMRDKANATGASEEIKGIIQEQINAIERSEEYQNAILLRDGTKNAETFVQSLTADQVRRIASGEMSDEEFNSLVDQYYAIEETTGEIDDNTSNIAKTLQNLDKTTLTNIVNKLKDARDATKESYEYEEKRKAVLEAEEALRKAQESRTVRVYNAKTGRWEQVVNEKDIESARERLEEARFAVESAAYDTIIKDIESGNATSRSILNTLANFAYAYGTGDFSAIKNDILSILQSSGITINQPSGGGGGKPFTKVQLYDNGGILYGLGGIKATSSAESVLDPDMTRKVLSPVSNKEFDTFVKDLGLLFGTASAYSQGTPIYHKNTSSDSHDSHYQINGVPIPTDIASRFTLSEIANQLSLIPS